ncbi:UNVERIFIED_CONTAM: hypothetical protein GTU68_032120, partial [Idotea baltica]|nr:hypothetical protein [Idotea baltica]
VNYPLDYESIQEYNLTVRVENNGPQQLASEATIYVVIEDVNDEIPLFTEREHVILLEGEPIGTKVTQINAIDKDGTYPNNEVLYRIVDSIHNKDRDHFEIREKTEIFTRTRFSIERASKPTQSSGAPETAHLPLGIVEMESPIRLERSSVLISLI